MNEEQVEHYRAVCKENEILKRQVDFLCRELGEAELSYNGVPRSSERWANISLLKAIYPTK